MNWTIWTLFLCGTHFSSNFTVLWNLIEFASTHRFWVIVTHTIVFEAKFWPLYWAKKPQSLLIMLYFFLLCLIEFPSAAFGLSQRLNLNFDPWLWPWLWEQNLGQDTSCYDAPVLFEVWSVCSISFMKSQRHYLFFDSWLRLQRVFGLPNIGHNIPFYYSFFEFDSVLFG